MQEIVKVAIIGAVVCTGSATVSPASAANADLGVAMVSPQLTTTSIRPHHTRYDLRVDNNGPETAADVVVTVKYTEWTHSNIGSSIWANSVTANGAECEYHAMDGLIDTVEWHSCNIPQMASGESVSIVVRQMLASDVTSVQIQAEVVSSDADDANATNDSVRWIASISEGTSAESGGGGGGTGLPGLLVLALIATRRTLQIVWPPAWRW